MERKCEIENCQNLGEVNKKWNGKKYRRPLCSRHHRIKYNKQPVGARERIKKFKELKGNKCELCGWCGPCDVHRKISRTEGGRYTFDNMICICPNCHRLEHKGLMKLPTKL